MLKSFSRLEACIRAIIETKKPTLRPDKPASAFSNPWKGQFMRMKLNQKIAACASARESVYEIAVESDFLSCDASNMVTSAEIAYNLIELTFRESSASKFLKDERFDGYHMVTADERRFLMFQVEDMVNRSRALDTLASGFSEALYGLRDQMKKADSATAAPERSMLDAAIAEWRTAFKAWKATDKGDESDIDSDNPEAKREQHALLALANHPCVSLAEVRRKADLFQTDQYLQSKAGDLTFDLLRSFAEAGGA